MTQILRTTDVIFCKRSLNVFANTIRNLSIDCVEKAGSGHAGTPMGCAELGAYLYGYFLNYNPKNPEWANRDRFILSAGHASMLQYACLHLSGFDLSLEDLKNFRQLNSKTPSHPEYGLTSGVETTTGLDGQGIAHGVGQALGLKLLSKRFNNANFSMYDSKVIVLAGDGCFMEGVSHETCSLAGHLKLDNLIVIYDSNQTSLDGFVTDSCSEDIKKRYEAYHWDVYEVDGHDFEEIHKVFSHLREKQDQPALVIAHTVIGKGASQAGSYLIHSNPIGKEECSKTKEAMGFPETEFYVPKEIKEYFSLKIPNDQRKEESWNQGFQSWKETHPHLYEEWLAMSPACFSENLKTQIMNLNLPEELSGRESSHLVINFLGDMLPGLYGGSADLARSDKTHMHQHSVVSVENFLGRNIKYGVREFGMATIAIGLAQTQKIIPFIGTFLAFSDYMLSPIRMAALMKLKIIYQLTHDSFLIGQDGPTHQPVEQLVHLRAIPHLQVIRPANPHEVKMAWIAALKYQGPTAIVLSKQNLSSDDCPKPSYEESMAKGAYVIKKSRKEICHFNLLATGSEVALALKVSSLLEKEGLGVQVVSMPCWQIFDAQPEDYQKNLLKPSESLIVSMEAAIDLGWHKYVKDGLTISLQTFGRSALASDLTETFGFTPEKITQKILSHYSS